MRTDELDRLLTEVHRDDPVPDFDATWRRAEARVGAREGSGLGWRRALVPVAAVGAITLIVVVIVTVGQLQGSGSPLGPEESLGGGEDRLHLALISELDDMPSWEAPLDGLESEWSYDDGYESSTDFLLSINIPAWNGAETQRSVL